ncbi:MAG TPA: energy transducer TonB [Pyrinomonadaceae bacterium]|nr:energy transducer TonB [Pyrinomonadaceae bacterium]
MNSYVKLGVLMLMLALKGFTSGQEPKADDLPAVTTAVAPNYFPTALHSHASGEVVVAVKIASDGSVTSSEAISGSAVLAAGSMQVARRWKFATMKDKNQIRSARLTFVYRLVPRDTPSDQLLPIFKPPYRVEITHVLPDETPLP